MTISDELVKQRAKELILSHATDVEWLTIHEAMEYTPWEEAEGLTNEEQDEYAHAIDKAIYHRARVEVYFD
jgi:hypothetical protein